MNTHLLICRWCSLKGSNSQVCTVQRVCERKKVECWEQFLCSRFFSETCGLYTNLNMFSWVNWNLMSTALLWSNMFPAYCRVRPVSELPEPLTTTWSQRAEETRWRARRSSYSRSGRLHLFPLLSSKRKKNLEAITAPSYLPLARYEVSSHYKYLHSVWLLSK